MRGAGRRVIGRRCGVLQRAAILQIRVVPVARTGWLPIWRS